MNSQQEALNKLIESMGGADSDRWQDLPADELWALAWQAATEQGDDEVVGMVSSDYSIAIMSQPYILNPGTVLYAHPPKPPAEQGVGEPVGIIEDADHQTVDVFIGNKPPRKAVAETGSRSIQGLDIGTKLYTHPPKPTGGGVPDGFVKKHKLDQVVEGAKRIEDMQAETIQQLHNDLRTAYLHQEPNEADPVWYWQGDGYDHPESLTSDAVVVIRADQLRTLLATQQPPTQESCHAGRDGDCIWKNCPQIRNNEPETNGRHCPLDNRQDPY